MTGGGVGEETCGDGGVGRASIESGRGATQDDEELISRRVLDEELISRIEGGRMLIDTDIALGLDVIRRGVDALELGGLFNPVRSVVEVAERVAGGVEALQIVHNGENHWCLLASIGNTVTS